ncbi:MAG: hypothetical protein K0R99_1715 [Microbacterium sp.]|nr:hypothetical protein [Microbacterium sp.]
MDAGDLLLGCSRRTEELGAPRDGAAGPHRTDEAHRKREGGAQGRHVHAFVVAEHAYRGSRVHVLGGEGGECLMREPGAKLCGVWESRAGQERRPDVAHCNRVPRRRRNATQRGGVLARSDQDEPWCRFVRDHENVFARERALQQSRPTTDDQVFDGGGRTRRCGAQRLFVYHASCLGTGEYDTDSQATPCHDGFKCPDGRRTGWDDV